MFDYGLIVAGGQGKRLRPLTNAMPKPLLPIGDKPIIQLILERMKDSGIKKVFISVNYKKEIIENYIRDGERYGLEVEYLEETSPTGTAGCITMLPKDFDVPLLMTNADLITDVDYSSLYKMLEEYELVLTGIIKKININFGVLHTGFDSSLNTWEEKPTMEYLINGGIYGVSSKVIDLVRSTVSPTDYFDMPSLWELLKKNNIPMGVHVHKSKWHDIGRIEDYMALAEAAGEVLN